MRRLALGTGLVALLLPARAQADTAVPVLLQLTGCTGLNETELRRIVAAELGAEAAEQSGPAVTHVSVTCDGPRVTLRVEDPLSRKAVQRAIDLGKAEPRAQTRLVAIASTELVLASWAELETNPNPQVEPLGPRPPATAQEAARGIAHEHLPGYEPKERHWYDSQTPKERGLQLLAVGSARSFFSYTGTLWGGGIRVGEERFRWIAWSADLLFEKGSIGSDTQHITLSSFTAGGRLLAYARAGHLSAGLGAGLRVGVAAASEAPSIAPWGWPLGAAAVALRLGRSVSIELSGEASYVVLPLSSGSSGTLRGAWFSGQLGVGGVFGTPERARP